MIIGGSVIVLLGAFEAMGSLRTLQTREGLEAFLAEPPGSSLGIGFEGAREMRRIAILVSGTAAVAAAILGIHVLKRNKSARIGLSVLAFPIFIAGSIAGGFASAVVTVSIVMLWLEPARSWFAGRPIPERFRLPREGTARQGREAGRDQPPAPDQRHDAYGAPGPRGQAGPPPQVQQPWGQQPQQPQQPWGQQQPQQPGSDPSGGPAPYQGFGSPGSTRRPQETGPQQHGPAQPYGQQHGQQWQHAPGPYGARPDAPRPTAVLAACVLTWLCTGLVTVMSVVASVAVANDPDLIMDALASQPGALDAGVTTSTWVSTVVGMLIVLVVWSVAAAVLAFFALRGQQWARVCLLVSAGIAAGLGLLGAISSWPLLVLAAAAIVTFVLLLLSDVSRWYASRGRMLG